MKIKQKRTGCVYVLAEWGPSFQSVSLAFRRPNRKAWFNKVCRLVHRSFKHTVSAEKVQSMLPSLRMLTQTHLIICSFGLERFTPLKLVSMWQNHSSLADFRYFSFPNGRLISSFETCHSCTFVAQASAASNCVLMDAPFILFFFSVWNYVGALYSLVVGGGAQLPYNVWMIIVQQCRVNGPLINPWEHSQMAAQ